MKGSASLTNIALLSENLSQIFTSSTSLIVSMNALVAYLSCALVMVLASDSDERQKQLLGLDVHNTIMKTIQNYLPTRNLIVCEMGLRSLRNIAAHDESAGRKSMSRQTLARRILSSRAPKDFTRSGHRLSQLTEEHSMVGQRYSHAAATAVSAPSIETKGKSTKMDNTIIKIYKKHKLDT